MGQEVASVEVGDPEAPGHGQLWAGVAISRLDSLIGADSDSSIHQSEFTHQSPCPAPVLGVSGKPNLGEGWQDDGLPTRGL